METKKGASSGDSGSWSPHGSWSPSPNGSWSPCGSWSPHGSWSPCGSWSPSPNASGSPCGSWSPHGSWSPPPCRSWSPLWSSASRVLAKSYLSFLFVGPAVLYLRTPNTMCGLSYKGTSTMWHVHLPCQVSHLRLLLYTMVEVDVHKENEGDFNSVKISSWAVPLLQEVRLTSSTRFIFSFLRLLQPGLPSHTPYPYLSVSLHVSLPLPSLTSLSPSLCVSLSLPFSHTHAATHQVCVPFSSQQRKQKQEGSIAHLPWEHPYGDSNAVSKLPLSAQYLLVGCLTSQQHASVSQERFAQTILRPATLKRKLQIKFSISPVSVYGHWVNQSQHWPYNARHLAG